MALAAVGSVCATVLPSLVSFLLRSDPDLVEPSSSIQNNRLDLAVHENAIQVHELIRIPVDELFDPYRFTVERESKRQYKIFNRDYWALKQKLNMCYYGFGAFLSALGAICLLWFFCFVQDSIFVKFSNSNIDWILSLNKFVFIVTFCFLTHSAMQCVVICLTFTKGGKVHNKQKIHGQPANWPAHISNGVMVAVILFTLTAASVYFLLGDDVRTVLFHDF